MRRHRSCGLTFAEALEKRVLFSFELVASGPSWNNALNPHGLVALGDKVYFAGTAYPSGVGYVRAFATDGTAAGTAELAGGDSGERWRYGGPAVAGGKVYFHGGSTSGLGIWASTGTAAGTTRLPIAGGDTWGPWAAPLGQKAVFLGRATSSRRELYLTDGTAAAPTMLSGALGAAHVDTTCVLGSHNGLVWFTDQTSAGLQRLGVTDGTVAGTRIIADLNTGTAATPPASFTAVGNLAYFQVTTAQGLKLWRSDGTAAGTGPVATTNVVIGGSMAELGGHLYFLAAPVTRGVASLYRTSPAADGIELVADVKFDTLRHDTSNLFRAGNLIYFDNREPSGRNDGLGGLWRTDGTAAGTRQIMPERAAGRFFLGGGRLWLGGTQYVIDLAQPDEPRRTTLPGAVNDPYGLPISMASVGRYLYFPHERSLYRALNDGPLLANAHVRVFHDADGNGAEGPGEGPYPTSGTEAGPWVYADVNNDGTRQNAEPEAKIRADGTATLIGLPDGQYPLRMYGTAFRHTLPHPAVVTVAGGQDPAPVLFGVNQNNRVFGSVYEDANANGTRDAGEPPVAGRRVYADVNGNKAFDAGETEALTDAGGAYFFEKVPGEKYILAELPAGWRATENAAGFRHSNYTGARDVTYGPIGQTTVPPPGRVLATVFFDHDGDGARGPTEGAANHTIRVFLDADGDGVRDDGELTRAGSGGSAFEFAQVPPGQYALRVEPYPGWVQREPAPVVDVVSNATAAVDAGIGPTGAAGQVAGTVYADDDFDAVRDSGERGIGGQSVYLDLDRDGEFDSPAEPFTVTDYFGRYAFTGLAAGDYRVDTLGPYEPMSHPGGRDVTFDGVTPVGGVDFSVVTSQWDARVVGRVYRDADGDGAFGPGDEPVPNVLVHDERYGSPGTFEPAYERSAVTDADGRYALLTSPGAARISVAVPTGWSAASPTSGEVVTAARQTTAGPDFALAPAGAPPAATPASVSGVFFHDADQDGARDATEPGGPAHVSTNVAAYVDLDGDALRDPGEPYAHPFDEDAGRFAFGGLPPGTYDVRVEARGGSALTTAPAVQTVTLAAGQAAALPAEFGLVYAPSEVTGEVYLDADNDGARGPNDAAASGVRVSIDVNGNGSYTDAVDLTAYTNAAGQFTFTHLSPGAYNVVARPDANHRQIEPAAGAPLVLHVSRGQDVGGLVLGVGRALGQLGGTLYHDDDRDGVRDAGEGTLAGWTVEVRDAAAAPTAAPRTARTDNQGRWLLDGLPAASYRVSLVLAAATFDRVAPAAPPHEHVVDLATGQVRGGIDFGVDTKPVTFTGEVFDDLDNDGARDAGEPPIPGVTVQLDGGTSVATGADGRFTFADLPTDRSSYTFRAVAPAGAVRSFPYPQDHLASVYPTPGTTVDVGRFGFHTPESRYIRGTAYVDANANGQRDPGEQPIQGRTIGLDLDHDQVLELGDAFTSTDANGNYVFARFDPRERYYVRDLLPQDWVGTAPPNGGWRVLERADGDAYSGVDFGSIAFAARGQLFHDQDADGARDAGEPGLAGRQVFADVNDNGRPDPAEPQATTDAAGGYGLLVSAAGSYRIRQVVPQGWTQSYPAGGAAHLAALAPDATAAGKDFGAVAVPAVTGVVVNDGADQRSRVTGLAVTFDREVTLGAGAFRLARAAGDDVPLEWTTGTAGGVTTAVLSFPAAAAAAGSLPDGVFALTVVASQVSVPGAPAAVMPADHAHKFHRLFSDADGDGDSDGADLSAFRAALNKTAALQPADYRWYLDYDDDGAVDATDLSQVRSRRSVLYQGY